MRLALVSDLHANHTALTTLTDILDAADKVVCLGDLTGYYCQVNETIDLLRSYNPLVIMGNHDYFVLHGSKDELPPSVKFGVDYANQVLTPANRAWLSCLPHSLGLTLDGLSCLFVHGSPWHPIDDYIYADSPLLAKLDDFQYDLVAFGQTHRPLLRNDKEPLLLNPGSVGQSRDAATFGKACAAIVNTRTREIEQIVRSYDMNSVVEQLLGEGAGDWAKKFLPTG